MRFKQLNIANTTDVQLIGPTILGDGTTHNGNPLDSPDKYVICNTTSLASATVSLYYKIPGGANNYLLYKSGIAPGHTLMFSSEEMPYDDENFGLFIKADSGTVTLTIKMKQ